MQLKLFFVFPFELLFHLESLVEPVSGFAEQAFSPFMGVGHVKHDFPLLLVEINEDHQESVTEYSCLFLHLIGYAVDTVTSSNRPYERDVIALKGDVH